MVVYLSRRIKMGATEEAMHRMHADPAFACAREGEGCLMVRLQIAAPWFIRFHPRPSPTETTSS
jgi:hypothetical protein